MSDHLDEVARLTRKIAHLTAERDEARHCVRERELAASALAQQVDERDDRIRHLDAQLRSMEVERDEARAMGANWERAEREQTAILDRMNRALTEAGCDPCGWCETKLAALIAERDAARSQLAEVTARLPKTADGVSIFDCSTIYHVHPDVQSPMPIKGVILDLWHHKAFAVYQRGEYLTECHTYSTPEAAAAAREGGGRDG